MSTTICAIWLLASVAGAEPPGIDFVSDVAMGAASLESARVREEVSQESSTTMRHPVVVCRSRNMPEPILCVDTSCSLRRYVVLNAGYHRQPYNHLIQFDYPWHRESACARCGGFRLWSDPSFQSQPVPAPLAPAEDTQRGGSIAGRPSAIRKVD